jgi:ATP-dependent Clp protease, protease subunit
MKKTFIIFFLILLLYEICCTGPINILASETNRTTDKENKKYSEVARKMKSEQQNTIWIKGEINDEMANRIIIQFLDIDERKKVKDIYLYIDSPGGSVTAGTAIYDMMNFVKSHGVNITTVNIGTSASMAAFILAAGTKGKRFSLNHGKIMLSQPFTRSSRTPSIEESKEIENIKHLLNKILAQNLGRSIEQVAVDTASDLWLSAEEAKNYGVIDFTIKNLDSIQY